MTEPIEVELKAILGELLPRLGDQAEDVAAFAAARADDLAIMLENGASIEDVRLAAVAARDRVLLHAAVQAVHAAEAVDASVRRGIFIALRMAAAGLAG